MARNAQDVLILDYSGPQGNFELQLVESCTVNRSKSKARVKTMNRQRRALAFQTGTQEVTLTLTVIPETGEQTEVDWITAWTNNEQFFLVGEKGLGGIREQFHDCEVSDVNDTFNEAGEARQEVTVEALRPQIET
jgi:hypothetical protein